jgi:hypothetical protein
MTRMGVSKDPSLLGEDGLVSRHLEEGGLWVSDGGLASVTLGFEASCFSVRASAF